MAEITLKPCPGCYNILTKDGYCFFSSTLNCIKRPKPTAVVDGKGDKGSLKEMKTPVNLMTPQFVEGIAEVLKFGAKKYAPHNWMRGIPFSELLAAIERHTLAIKRGEFLDPETKMPHTWHIGCETMFLDWMLHGPNAQTDYVAMDDLKFRAPHAKDMVKA